MHPLEPLTAAEVQQTVGILTQNGKVNPTTRFVSVSLKEPQKQSVHHFSESSPPDREAEAVLFDNALNRCYEASVSLTAQRLLSWKHVADVQLYAPNHQHFFNVRLDFDLDGTANTIQQVDVVPDPIDQNNPYENAFVAQATPLVSEKQARANLNLESARTWKIVNPAVLNAVGEPVGYKFMPGDNCYPMASKEAWWRKRAGFVNQHVWVTPYRDDEKYAAGDYSNQSRGGDGLIRWTEQDRPIANTDVVFWYTFGHTHIPRPEDYPVMPTAYIGFLLKPNGFFRQNPGNDVPPSKKKTATKNCCH